MRSHDGASALAGREFFDVIVFDVMSPTADSYDVCLQSRDGKNAGARDVAPIGRAEPVVDAVFDDYLKARNERLCSC